MYHYKILTRKVHQHITKTNIISTIHEYTTETICNKKENPTEKAQNKISFEQIRNEQINAKVSTSFLQKIGFLGKERKKYMVLAVYNYTVMNTDIILFNLLFYKRLLTQFLFLGLHFFVIKEHLHFVLYNFSYFSDISCIISDFIGEDINVCSQEEQIKKK